jgi:AbrB family looped-hinge helix DNA binding protein
MAAMMVSIDRAGRVVIPKEVRDRLSITPDTELEISVRDDAIEIAPIRRRGRRVVEVDGWPVIEPAEGLSVTDADVQRWRDDSQR